MCIEGYMGHRANLILVDTTGYHLHYCHWCSNQITRDVFWGAEFTIPYILQQRLVNHEDGWLDDVWAEGGVLVDTARRVVLLYGGEDIQYFIPLRRLYLELMAETWSGWEIRWAHEGILEMADYVGVARNRVTARREVDDRVRELTPPDKPEYTITIGSAVLEDGALRLYALGGDLDWYLNRGPALSEMARANPGIDSLPLDEWQCEFPQSGFHLDTGKQQVAFWASNDQSLVERVRPLWTGWDMVWLKDGYEYQTGLAGDRLRLPLKTTQDLLSDLEHILMIEGGSGLRTLRDFLQDRQTQGEQVEVNPYALRDDPQKVPLTNKRQILDAAIAAWKRKKWVN